jgi:hypothetical protein
MCDGGETTMESGFAPPGAVDGRRRKWVGAAIFGGLVLAYAAYAFAFYELVTAIF